jgi:hypothetical protein
MDATQDRLDDTARRLEQAVLAMNDHGKSALLPLRVTALPGRPTAPDNSDALVHPATGRRPLAFCMEHERISITPTAAQRIAHRLLADHLDRSRMDEEYAEVLKRLEGFRTTLPHPPIVALHEAGRTGQMPQASHLMVADMLDHMLQRRIVRFRNVTSHSSGTMGERIRKEQERRLTLLREAGGDRASALTCCPVAAAALEEGGDAVARLRKALAVTVPDETFVDGAYRPWTRVGDASWRNGTLWLPGRLPGLLETALPGMALSAVVEHPLLPRGALIVAVQYRRSKDQTMVRTDATTVPLGPLLERHDIAVG